MVTFKQDVGERIKYVNISREALQRKIRYKHSELIKDPFRQVLEKSHDKISIFTKQQIISDNYTVTCTQNSVTHNVHRILYVIYLKSLNNINTPTDT